MSLPWAARGLKIPYVVRNDWQSRGLAMAAALRKCHGRETGRLHRRRETATEPLVSKYGLCHEPRDPAASVGSQISCRNLTAGAGWKSDPTWR
ncbi:hypothetical protein GCM10018966_066680 [Streptomyces yanii]